MNELYNKHADSCCKLIGTDSGHSRLTPYWGLRDKSPETDEERGTSLQIKISFQRKECGACLRKTEEKPWSVTHGECMASFSLSGSCVGRSSIVVASGLGKLDNAEISSVTADMLESLKRAQILLWYSVCSFSTPPGMQQV